MITVAIGWKGLTITGSGSTSARPLVPSSSACSLSLCSLLFEEKSLEFLRKCWTMFKNTYNRFKAIKLRNLNIWTWLWITERFLEIFMQITGLYPHVKINHLNFKEMLTKMTLLMTDFLRSMVHTYFSMGQRFIFINLLIILLNQCCPLHWY